MATRRRVSTRRPRRIPAWQTQRLAISINPLAYHRPEMMEHIRQLRAQQYDRRRARA